MTRIGIIASRVFIGFRVMVFLGASAVFCIAIVIPACQSYNRHMQGFERKYAASEVVRKAEQEKHFGYLCPIYAKASTWDRWLHYRNLSWCKDYLHRL